VQLGDARDDLRAVLNAGAATPSYARPMAARSASSPMVSKVLIFSPVAGFVTAYSIALMAAV
jgi:hypothetical protein